MAFEADAPKPSPVYLKRVIRTDFFLSGEEVAPRIDTSEEFPTLSVAWLHDHTYPSPENYFGVKPFFHTEGPPNIRSFIGASIAIEALLRMQGAAQEVVEDFIRQRQQEVYLATDSYRHTFTPPPIVQALLQQDIVLEKSPPYGEMISTVLGKTSSVTLGTLFATTLDTHSLIMALTIPAGVILMGSAIGISTGLQRGLAKRVEHFIDPKPTPTPPRPRRKKAAS
jgi:hypothetical protein